MRLLKVVKLKKAAASLHTLVPSILYFVKRMVLNSRTLPITLLCSIVYLDRLRQVLPRTARGSMDSYQRIFCASLILSTKYIHDNSIKNKYWMQLIQKFDLIEINQMEQQMLMLLDYKMDVKEENLMKIIQRLPPGTLFSDESPLMGLYSSSENSCWRCWNGRSGKCNHSMRPAYAASNSFNPKIPAASWNQVDAEPYSLKIENTAANRRMTPQGMSEIYDLLFGDLLNTSLPQSLLIDCH